MAAARDDIDLQIPLTEAIRNLSPVRSDDFTEDTILGSDINQIRHLFYWLHSEQRPVQLIYGAEQFRSRVEEVENAVAYLRVPGFREERARRCRIKFEIVNILYQFEVPIVDIEDDLLILKIPAYIQSAKRRKYRRIRVDDMFMRWGILYQPLYGTRGTGQILESRYTSLVDEVKRREPDLYLINRIVTEQIERISPQFEVKFYPKDYRRNLMEEMIAAEQKTFFLRDVQDIESYYKNQRLRGLINYNKEYRDRLRTESEEDVVKFFEKKRHDDMYDMLANYVCAPLMIFDDVIGHIYVYSTVFDRRLISSDDAEHIDLLAQLLNYAMSKTVLARSYSRHTFTRIVNISMGGLLFELTNKTVFDYLTYHDHLEMHIQMRHHMMHLHGEITRYFPTKDGFNIGVNFYDAGPDDYRVLENFIYERSRSMFE